MRTRVLFPAPFGPAMPRTSPGRISRSRPASATVRACRAATRGAGRLRVRRSCRPALADIGERKVEGDRADRHEAEEQLLHVRPGGKQGQALLQFGEEQCAARRRISSLPPERLAPPMITAAKTGKVNDKPMFGWVVWIKEKSRIPAIAASMLQIMKARILLSVRPAVGRTVRRPGSRRSPSSESRRACGATGTRRPGQGPRASR